MMYFFEINVKSVGTSNRLRGSRFKTLRVNFEYDKKFNCRFRFSY